MRCRAPRPINTWQGFLPKGLLGTIVSEMENLGRWLITVVWDNGLIIPMLAGEVEILEGEEGETHARE